MPGPDVLKPFLKLVGGAGEEVAGKAAGGLDNATTITGAHGIENAALRGAETITGHAGNYTSQVVTGVTADGVNVIGRNAAGAATDNAVAMRALDVAEGLGNNAAKMSDNSAQITEAVARGPRKGMGAKGVAITAGSTGLVATGGTLYATSGSKKPKTIIGKDGKPRERTMMDGIKEWAASNTEGNSPFGLGSLIGAVVLGVVGILASPNSLVPGIVMAVLGALGGHAALRAVGGKDPVPPQPTPGTTPEGTEPAGKDASAQPTVEVPPLIPPKGKAPAKPNLSQPAL